ncbi:translocation/assembly module TamB domain-containing protein [Emticicia sp. BO119]|uniref:translocation/assembly module TamB domain-containing protein n=1 Tax=Emticicia sp. BO119 TaxID=2757768 RepID=UPI0015F0D6F7|nr:translocation/assembly module TamB domain-containing protein [Emticicia sp. BO119]MBA4852205.1 translocation/assembly module TamB domain-containing protein [Emticicia sp. BO119]
MKRLTRIFLWFIVGILALVGLIIVFVQSPTGQDFLTKQAVSYLRKKLGTPVSIQKVRFRIPDWITLEGVFIPDLKKDTLLAGKRLHIDLDMVGLLSNKVKLNQIELEGIRVNINRTLPDTVFNFNYILEAFMSKEVDTTSSSDPFDISLKHVKLNNVKVTYKDAIIGTDADLYLKDLSTEFKEFNINKSQYHFANVNANGGSARLRLFKSVKPSTVIQRDTLNPEVAAADTLDLNVGTVTLANFDWLLESEEDGMRNGVKLGKLTLEGDKIYLSGQKVIFKKVALENTEAFVEMANKPKKEPAKKPEENNTDNGPGWAAIIGNIEVNKVRVKYDDKYAPRQLKGLDYGHLDIANLEVVLNNFVYSQDNISGQLAKTTFTEQSGLNLQNLTTNFTYSSKEIGLRNFFLKTPQTVVRDEMVMQYDTIADLSNNLGSVRIKVNLKRSQLAMKDLLILVPDLANNPTFKENQNDIIMADGIVTGRVNNLTIPKLSITGFGATRVIAKGNITGLPDANKMGFNVDIEEVSTTKEDIIKLAGKDVIPESIELPEKITIRGKLTGKANDLNADASLNSDLGVATFTGNLKNFVTGNNQAYDGKLTLEDFDAGKLIKQSENIGKLTLEVNAKGTGIDPKTMNATIDGTAKKAVLKGYEYNDLILKGDIHNQIANINANLDDPNADFKLIAKADLSKEFPAVEGNVSINNLDLRKLNLYAEDLKVKGHIKLNMASTDPKNPIGTVSINQAVIETMGKVIPLDTTNLTIQNAPDGHHIILKSPVANAEVDGNFDYTRLLDMVLTEVNKYFKVPDMPFTPVAETYNIHIDAQVNQHPVIQSFVPELTKLGTVTLVAEIDNRKDTTLQASVIVPLVEYDSSTVRNANLKLYALGNKVNYNGAISEINVSDFSIKRTSLNGEIADNTLTTNIALKDSLNKDRFAFHTRLQSVEDKYRINLSNQGTLIDYKEWRSDSTGYIEYGKQGLLVKQFLLEQDQQKLLVNSTTNEPNSPITVEVDSLDIKPFVTIATLDSTLAGGKLNGDFKLSNYMTANPAFTGDLMINNFTLTQIPIGNVAVNANNETADRIATKASISSNKNDIQLTGNYILKPKGTLDFNVDIKRLGAETVQAFSFGQLKNAKGNLTGNLTLKGEPNKPLINGQIKLDDVSLSLTQLGAKYVFNNQTLAFNNSDIKFNNFVVTDTLGQKLTVNGNLNIQNIPDFSYKLDVDARNFMVLNGSRKDNDFFYGKGFIDADLNVTGVGAKPSIDGSVKLKEGSDITVLLPDDSIGETETDGIVEFINMKNPAADSLAKDSTALVTNYSDIASEMALNIEVDDKSQLTIIIDEVNGDNLKIKGNAQLNTGITPSGEFYIFGLYELTSGQYDLTFEVLKRQFTIEKGSTLLWTGDPMKAQIDITAAYSLNTELTSLSDEARARYYGKVPVKVLLKMQGNLSSPDISFGIVLDETRASSDVKNFVEEKGLFKTFENDPVAMNKEVFSLLILNRFSGQQSSDFFSGAGAEAIARQSVSKLLTDQLNVLAGDLIKGVKLDFNLNSDFSAAQTGGTGVRTDLNVGLSKAFLNDRLTVSVGRNFQIENTTGIQKSSTEIFDNIALNYNLTKDGRYLFRAYRKNEFFILDGYVQETGVSFAVTLNYETFKELFSKKK